MRWTPFNKIPPRALTSLLPLWNLLTIKARDLVLLRVEFSMLNRRLSIIRVFETNFPTFPSLEVAARENTKFSHKFQCVGENATKAWEWKAKNVVFPMKNSFDGMKTCFQRSNVNSFEKEKVEEIWKGHKELNQTLIMHHDLI